MFEQSSNLCFGTDICSPCLHRLTIFGIVLNSRQVFVLFSCYVFFLKLLKEYETFKPFVCPLQGRGTPHIHFLLWLDKAANKIGPDDMDDTSGDGLERIKAFVEKKFSCKLPAPWNATAATNLKNDLSPPDDSNAMDAESTAPASPATAEGPTQVELKNAELYKRLSLAEKCNIAAAKSEDPTVPDQDPTAPSFRPTFGGGYLDICHPCAEPVDALKDVSDWSYDFKNKQFYDERVHKNFRNILLATQMHWCSATCHKYGHFNDCRFRHPWNPHDAMEVMHDVDRKNRIRRSVEAPRNNENVNRHCMAAWPTCFMKVSSFLTPNCCCTRDVRFRYDLICFP